MKKNVRKLVDKSGCFESNGLFENVRIKVNQRSYFTGCKFINCTFVGRTKLAARFDACITI